MSRGVQGGRVAGESAQAILLTYLRMVKSRSMIKGFRLVPLGLYSWVLESFYETLGNYIGSCKNYIKATCGKPSRGTTLGAQPWNS